MSTRCICIQGKGENNDTRSHYGSFFFAIILIFCIYIILMDRYESIYYILTERIDCMYWYVYFEEDYDYPEDNDIIDVQGPFETDELPYDNEFVYCVLADSYDEAIQLAKEDYETMRLSEPESPYFPSSAEEYF